MHGKEFMVDVLRTFFLVVTLINVVMLVLGTHTAPDMLFGYEAFAAPLIYGAAGTLPNIVMYTRRELKIKELIVQKIAQLLLIEVVVLFVAFHNQSSFWKQPEIIISVGVSILIIYVIGCVIDWIQNSVSAKRMTTALVKFQESKA